MGKSRAFRIELKPASDLLKGRTTVSGVATDLSNHKLPIFYHSYDPQSSFVAVPPDWLEDLLKKAGEKELKIELNQRIQEIQGKKEEIKGKIKKSLAAKKE